MTPERSERPRTEHQVLAFSPYFLPGIKGGGPIRALVEILESVPDNVTIYLVTSDRDLGDTRSYPGLASRVASYGRHKVYYWDRTSLKSWLRLSRLLRARQFHILFLNSLWSPQFTMLPWVLSQARAIRSGVVLIAPRGELSPGALGLKTRKKQLALATWGRLLSRTEPIWQVSNDLEGSHVRDAFPNARVIVQPDSRGPIPQDLVVSEISPQFVFVSRISPKKNLRFLLEALSDCTAPLTLDILGPIEDPEHWAECQRVIDELPDHISVSYAGLVPMEEVVARLGQYDAFLFPTLGENFGFVIPESLSAGCPVMSSAHTPWTSLLAQGCGLVLPLSSTGAWSREIDRWARLSSAERTAKKRQALKTYTRWHRSQIMTSALERALTSNLSP